jgi:hypothetical protein
MNILPCARIGKGGVIDSARMLKLTLARVYKAFVGAKFELESFDCGIVGISHGAQCLNHCDQSRDLILSARFTYITIGRSIKRQIRKGTRFRL